MKLGGMAQKIIGALASGGVSRGSTGGARAAMRGAQTEDEGAEDTGRFSRDSEPPMSLADQRRQTAGIERAGYAAAGRPGGASSAEYMERIRRARGY